MDWWNNFKEFERTFDGVGAVNFTKSHSELPILICAAYLVFIFQVPQYLDKALELKLLNALWDLILAVFSIFGAFATVPVLLGAIQERGFFYTICERPHNWYGHGASGLWVCLFIYSKIPELMDTVFLVLQKKKVIFLHWFHHITVLLYCWHAHHNSVAPGLWFAAMNYSVHSVMYSYYFFTAVGLRKWVKPIAPLITGMQLLQMVGGVVVTVSAAQHYFKDPSTCSTDASNLKLGLAMYASYFVLFAILFHNLYIKPTTKVIQTGCPDIASSMSINDATGFFHDNSNKQDTKKSQ